MSQAPSMPIFTDALLGDTTHLSMEEFGAYCMILFVTWRNNGAALPDDDVRFARMCRVTVGRWRSKIRPALEAFFDLSGGTWRQKRLEKEWEFVQERAANSRRNGSKGGRPKPQKTNDTANPAGSSQDTPEETPEQPTHTHTQSPNGDSSAVGADKRDIIAAFDQARIDAFGAMQARPWPNSLDAAVAERWLAAGADLDLCRAVFVAGMQRKARSRDRPPDSLKFFDAAIAQALAERSRPMPTVQTTGKTNGKRPHHEPKRDPFCAILEQQFG
jgi:uncharacterized protein YdaU (DUF1376 family)